MPRQDGLSTDEEVFADVGRALRLRPGTKAPLAERSPAPVEVEVQRALRGEQPLSLADRVCFLAMLLEDGLNAGGMRLGLRQAFALVAGISEEAAGAACEAAVKSGDLVIEDEEPEHRPVFECIVCEKELPDDDQEAVTCSEACAEKAVADGLVWVEELPPAGEVSGG
jgi:hypothetical protein